MGDEILGVSKCLLHFFSLLFSQVTLCSNTVRDYNLELVLDVEGVGQEVLALTLTARYQKAFLAAACLSSCIQHQLPGCRSKGEVLLSELHVPI